MLTNSISSSSHGKIILSGEHSVVYGKPAIAIPSSQYLKITIKQQIRNTQSNQIISQVLSAISPHIGDFSIQHNNWQISGTLPKQSGMGSSAALANAVVKLVAKLSNLYLTNEIVFAAVQASEKLFHGNPSGIDAATIIYNQPILFSKNNNKPNIKTIDTNYLPKFLVIHSGAAAESTKEMVEKVKQHHDATALVAEIGEVTKQMHKNLINNNFDAQLIDKNHQLLNKLGVVGDVANRMIAKIKSWGGTAKISGAGGLAGGSGIIIAQHENLNYLQKCCEAENMPIVN